MINNSLVIGVAGGSGSGKSTFAKRICDYFGDKAVLISCDNYYLAHDDIPLEKRAKLNYDIPEAFEFVRSYAETDERIKKLQGDRLPRVRFYRSYAQR